MYNEESVVFSLRQELEAFMCEVAGDVEAIIVNDGSTDRTLEKIFAWASEDHRIKVIHLSRNFGHANRCHGRTRQRRRRRRRTN